MPYKWYTFSCHILGLPCACKSFVNQFGNGNCQTRSEANLHLGKKMCYVVQPSGCDDLVESGSNPGEMFSAKACTLKGCFTVFCISSCVIKGMINGKLQMYISKSFFQKKAVLSLPCPQQNVHRILIFPWRNVRIRCITMNFVKRIRPFPMEIRSMTWTIVNGVMTFSSAWKVCMFRYSFLIWYRQIC